MLARSTARKSLMLTVTGAMLALAGSANAALIFNFGAGTGNANADAGFTQAASYLSSQFEDNLTLNIVSGFGSLGATTLGQASSTTAKYDFNAWKTAMQGDQTSVDDNTMVANLPTGSAFNPYINHTADNPFGSDSPIAYVDNDGGANNTNVRLTSGNAKALGLVAGNDAATDATITFNSDFSWDFDPTDGIDAGAIDFVGVAIHEIMHAMGFVSGVDVLDFNAGTFNGPFTDDQYSYVTGLDFTRFSQDAINAGADIDWTVDARDKFFSIDGGATALIGAPAWSTGDLLGDGNQASHWKDHLGIGIMDPTAQPAGTANTVSGWDLLALDVIGWNLFSSSTSEVPAPAPLALLLAGLLALRGRRQAHA